MRSARKPPARFAKSKWKKRGKKRTVRRQSFYLIFHFVLALEVSHASGIHSVGALIPFILLGNVVAVVGGLREAETGQTLIPDGVDQSSQSDPGNHDAVQPDGRAHFEVERLVLILSDGVARTAHIAVELDGVDDVQEALIGHTVFSHGSFLLLLLATAICHFGQFHGRGVKSAGNAIDHHAGQFASLALGHGSLAGEHFIARAGANNNDSLFKRLSLGQLAQMRGNIAGFGHEIVGDGGKVAEVQTDGLKAGAVALRVVAQSQALEEGELGKGGGVGDSLGQNHSVANILGTGRLAVDVGGVQLFNSGHDS